VANRRRKQDPGRTWDDGVARLIHPRVVRALEKKMRQLREFADRAAPNPAPLGTEPWWHLIAIGAFVAGVGVGMIISGIAVIAR
jgi:hypothetical protein